jgi:hypothetical protein
MGHLVCSLVELAIGALRPSIDNRNSVRGSGRLLLKAVMEAFPRRY